MQGFRIAVLAAVLAAGVAGRGVAGEQYVDASGFAVSGYDVVAYFDMAQVPVGSPQPQAIPGRADITASHNGGTFAFASAANRARFLADPDRYAPQFDGHCAFGVAKGGKVPGNPHLWRIVDGKLYLNIVPRAVELWEADIPANISMAEAGWPALEPASAAIDPVPGLDAAAPVTE